MKHSINYYQLNPLKLLLSIILKVVSGGNFDVDMTFSDPNKNLIKAFQREQYEYFDHSAQIEGQYEVSLKNVRLLTSSSFHW